MRTNVIQSGMTYLTIDEGKASSEWTVCDYDYDYDYDDEYDEDSVFRASINRRPTDEDIEASKHWHCPAFDKLLKESIRKSKMPKPEPNKNNPKQWGYDGVWGFPDTTNTVQEPHSPKSSWSR